MTEPWVAFTATMHRNPKMTELPNDTARYGWMVAVMEAKLLRRQGGFAPGQWIETMGRYARFSPHYLAAGLLHRAPLYCGGLAQCMAGRGPFPDGMLVIHDWPVYQREAAARTARWRNGQGDAIGDGERDVFSDGIGDVSLVRALSPVSSTLSRSSSEGGSGGKLDDWRSLQVVVDQLTGRDHAMPNRHGGHGPQACNLLERHGLAAVTVAMQNVASDVDLAPTIKQLVFGASDYLDAIPKVGRRDIEASARAISIARLERIASETAGH